ncbi:alpha/beta hydrolase [Sagittula sp. SSi028]|uniref:alpha/beta hydrolase n=1 Tax=Sagittula sp. SSi028 TaxID=3400636 RepID=UPI003AF74340
MLQRPGDLHWISCGVCPTDRVVLYFHGGGFIAGSPHTHRAMLGALSQAAGVEVCAPRYPLAQTAPFPAQIEAAHAAWARLQSLGYAADRIVVGGDSAGGGLALCLVAALCQQGTPPAGVFTFSPWTDLSASGESLRRNADRDPLLPANRIEELAALILCGADACDPRASALFAEYPRCPPVWMAWGETEVLYDDCARMVTRLRQFGAQVTTERHPTAPHVWPLFQGWVPEATATLRRAARFVQASLDETSR